MSRKTKSTPRSRPGLRARGIDRGTTRTKLDPALRIVYTIQAKMDDTPVRGTAMASGDNELDRETENEILERLAQGDIWAWAFVQVIAEDPAHQGYQGIASLGACSYRNESDFRKDAYYKDLCIEAYKDLLRQVKENEGE